MDSGQKILSEVKARQQRQQEERTDKRVKQLRRQARELIRAEKIEQEIRVLKQDKRGRVSNICCGFFFLVGVVTLCAFLVGFLQALIEQQVPKPAHLSDC
jgi:hypothetical protein